MRIDRRIDQLESRNMRFRTALALMATATVVGVTVVRPCLALDAVEAHDSMVRNDTGRIIIVSMTDDIGNDLATKNRRALPEGRYGRGPSAKYIGKDEKGTG